MGEYRVRGDEYYLRGHLPGEPILPGVLLVEAGAQVAGVVAQKTPPIHPLPRLKLTALRAVKIFGTARPGETLLHRSHHHRPAGPAGPGQSFRLRRGRQSDDCGTHPERLGCDWPRRSAECQLLTVTHRRNGSLRPAYRALQAASRRGMVTARLTKSPSLFCSMGF